MMADMAVDLYAAVFYVFISSPEAPEKLPDYFGSVITLRIIAVKN
jgi:hypothetical protein